eukprot:7577233-Heterocapsa_arctica.AAC.1
MSATSFNVSTQGPHQRPLARGRHAAEPMGAAMLGSPAHSLPAPRGTDAQGLTPPALVVHIATPV